MESSSVISNQEESRRAEFEVEITYHSVKVRLNASDKSPRGRFYWGAFYVVAGIGAICFLVFADGKHGEPGIWHDFATRPANSAGFIVPLVILLATSALMVLLSWRYVVLAHPSDETFYCDHSTLTISRVRWLDIHNRDWQTRSYRPNEITSIKYKVIARAKGGAVYGLHLKAAGRTERILPGLGTHDAGKILKAVKAFGICATE